jgi:hypothetical protein
MSSYDGPRAPRAATPAHSSRAQGAFVYTGSGKKQSADAPLSQRLCAKKARDVQWCLAKCNHKEKYCVEVIKILKDCIAQAQALEAAENSSQHAQ